MDHSKQNPQNSQQSGSDGESDTLDRVHELSWALLDEHIAGEEMAELEDRLLNDSTARDSYIRCVQLHSDLISHYAQPAKASGGSPAKTPILGFLGEGLPQFGTPTADDATA